MFKKIPVLRAVSNIQTFVKLVLASGGYICGGYARYACSPSGSPIVPNDLDIFMTTDSKERLDTMISVLEAIGLVRSYESDLAYSFKHSPTLSIEYKKLPQTIQLIKPRNDGNYKTFAEPEDLLGNFDFTVSRAAIISTTECLVDEDFERDEKAGKLVIKNIVCPISQVCRIVKYTSKGYRINIPQIMKLFIDYQNRSEEYKETISEIINKISIAVDSGETDEEAMSELYENLNRLSRID